VSNASHEPWPTPWFLIPGTSTIARGNPNGPHEIIIQATSQRGDAKGRQRATAARIVAVANACEGINPEAVPDMLAALKFALDPGSGDWRSVVEDAIEKAEGDCCVLSGQPVD
jgi:hypothetical protein